MLNFKKISNLIHYWLDYVKVSKLIARIEYFKINDDKIVIVAYRIGRQKRLNKLPVEDFSNRYFDAISNYDRYRLTKFLTIQKIINILVIGKQDYIKVLEFARSEMENERIF